MLHHDTIVAPITPPGRGGVAVIRISGVGAIDVVRSIVPEGALFKILDNPRLLVLSRLSDLRSSTPDLIDEGLVVFFPAPHSFTGEDVVELNLHGSPYLVAQLVQLCCDCGARMARPGEFSERAFLNGRIDLTQAEAIADLIAAETEAQAQVAREQFQGKLAAALSELGEPLRTVLAEIEAYIDFPDEGIDFPARSKWEEAIDRTLNTLSHYIESYKSGRLYREGVKVAICGLPNAGKSSLLNSLLGEERVIVSAVPGTTRDAIEEHLSINGLLVRICDTAGIVTADDLEHCADEIEQRGMSFSWKRIEAADLVLLVVDPLAPMERQSFFVSRLRATSKKYLIVLNKADLGLSPEFIDSWTAQSAAGASDVVAISAKTHLGLEVLRGAIYASVTSSGHSASSVLITSERHYQLLCGGQADLLRAKQALNQQLPPELIALEIRSALSKLSEIIGITTPEDTLNLIFSRFCIGK